MKKELYLGLDVADPTAIATAATIEIAQSR